ncbi:dienelactone hydrolase [Pyrenophora tritici-repentis]|uniref:1-alkyl-2-acetylglycerophosphocholine esterase n=2 Tax=Pyrenophora tritici-repentis TaxID=45151 RepID=A0A2W1CS21_9PLEO|nr:PAF acetylhydrolase family protein [Pyrenophora tritici-repentis Pt-1C-BFP]KAA8619473.1 PAF acetylhydrolase family protein [Pyrenophora tritici-repentis]EDU47265.1 PAF acetylhydrolase family protein [Pyrenophora tritici-repentis Pt-1C-BFP]KAI1510756.1 isoform II [Pyrenophora tritici-repentis]KAI1522755.1 dienelactone hydrolase [Pyrenophora tritici-repentis]KAI1536757.1 dienelactone hydrolase [Pyrenophora tritici-repentis]
MLFRVPLLTLLFGSLTAGYVAPYPPGKYNVTLTTGTLTDYTRDDPFIATPTPRKLMVTVFQPATCESTVLVPYMPNKTAEYQGPFIQKYYNISDDLSPLFLEARLPVCPADPKGCSPVDDGPVLLFSPGYTGPRLFYNVVAAAIASEGFTVITIDHPGDANIVTYPDGHAVYNNRTSTPDIADWILPYLSARVADASFVIDQLSNKTAIAELLPQRGPQAFATDRVAMLGHSLGGATAVAAASQDPRIRAAIDWDGSFFGSTPPSGLSKPVLYVSEANATDATWVSLWPQLNGPKLWVEIADTTHQSFIDAPSLLRAAGLTTPAFPDVLGTIDPAQLIQILVAYTKDWMNGAFAGKIGGPLLEGLEPDRFPEVSTVRKGNF